MDFLLREGTVRSAQPALSFGLHAGDEAVDSVCRHDIAQQGELELRSVQEPSCSV